MEKLKCNSCDIIRTARGARQHKSCPRNIWTRVMEGN